MEKFLYERITEGRPKATGTLAEPNGAPEPRFALQGTVYWMRALAILVLDKPTDWASMQAFYQKVQRYTSLSEPAANTIFEQLLMSRHHLSALQAMVRTDSDRNLARVAVMAWYYGIYCAASAMIAAKDSSQQQDHAGTATQWDRQIAEAGLIPRPFDYRLTTLIEKDAEMQLALLRGSNSFTLSSCPTSAEDAHGACVSYLSGTRKYRQWQIEEELRVKELPRLGLSNFRSPKGRELRDSRLRNKSVGFIHRAFRYRGKANYRDVLFLTYGAQVGTLLHGFIPDMETVLRAFVVAAGAFCARRVDRADWQAFHDDLTANLKLSVMLKDVWS
jgi:hypothetical protein